MARHEHRPALGGQPCGAARARCASRPDRDRSPARRGSAAPGPSSSAAASASRWRMPSEYFRTRSPARSASPTWSSTSSTRFGPMRSIAPSSSRLSRPLIVGNSAGDSTIAPTARIDSASPSGHRAAEQPHRAGRRPHQAEQAADRRGLARAVRPEEAEHAPFGHGEVEPVDRDGARRAGAGTPCGALRSRSRSLPSCVSRSSGSLRTDGVASGPGDTRCGIRRRLVLVSGWDELVVFLGGSAAMIASRSAYSASSISGAAASPTADQSVRRISHADDRNEERPRCRGRARAASSRSRPRVARRTRSARRAPGEHVVATTEMPQSSPRRHEARLRTDASGLDESCVLRCRRARRRAARRARPPHAAGRVGCRAEHRRHLDARRVVWTSTVTVSPSRESRATVSPRSARPAGSRRRRSSGSRHAVRRRPSARRSCRAPRRPGSRPALAARGSRR